MLKKRTKILILVAMVALLGVTGYLNIALNNNVVTEASANVTNANYFDTYRTDRQSTRDQELLYYNKEQLQNFSKDKEQLKQQNSN